MKNKKAVVLLFLCSLYWIACNPLKPLSMQRMDNKSNKFNLNGFYSSRSAQLENINGIFVPYSNGVFLSFGEVENINDWNTYFAWVNNSTNRKNIPYYKTVPYWWGVYHVTDENTINLEGWISGDGTYPTIKYFGKVVNDTTLIIKYPSARLDTFYFVPFSPKPDSTNRFIK
jgi:hypothetical protein